MNAWRGWKDVLGSGRIPFAETGGGDVFFLDSSSCPMSVKVWFHGSGAVVDIADSFEEFVDSLYIDPDFI